MPCPLLWRPFSRRTEGCAAAAAPPSTGAAVRGTRRDTRCTPPATLMCLSQTFGVRRRGNSCTPRMARRRCGTTA
eukprot:1529913-Alexandrium_andersonii.AAC.1